ncbi:PTS galactitol transporter subunit IIC [Liquorilactobacillus hordei]|uniref:PTS galactitol transporter subunit IIC n=1 Tax=Liquorilactobacillus hordei TaxID=468911 RepID=UPI0039E97F42
MAIIQWFVNLGASVILPILIFLFALVLGIKPAKAFKSGITIGIGFVGLNLIIELLTKNLGPAAKAMVENFGLHLTSIDVGGPAAQAISYGTVLGSLAIPIGIILNVVLLLTKLTKTLDVDVWNFWHIAFTGSLVYMATKDFALGIVVMIIHMMLLFLLADISAPLVQKYFGLEGISFPHGTSLPGFLIALPLNWIFDHIPGMSKIKITSSTIQKRLGILGDSTFIGLIIGLVIGFLAKYPVDKILQLGVNTAVVLLLMPRMVSILMEGLTPISEGAGAFVKKRFPGRDLYIGMDSALAVGQEAVLSSGLVLIPITLLIAIVLPGNKLLPFADLAMIPFLLPLMAAVFKGDIFRTILGGLVEIITCLYIGSWVAPFVTMAAKAANFKIQSGSSVSTLTEGGLWTTLLFVGIGKLFTWGGVIVIGILVLLAMIWQSKRSKTQSQA